MNWGDVAFLVFLWVTIICSFLVGCAWNAGAYDRGYKDAALRRIRR